MTRRLVIAPLAVLLMLFAVACGDDATPGATGSPPDETVDETPDTVDGDDGDEFPTQQAIDDARSVLGMDEADLPDDVRIGRRGDEQMALTQDYRLGRRTVELDEDEPGSGYRVTSVTVELPGGPETYHLEPS